MDSTHVKACANSKKMRKRAASQEALWYDEELKKEIDEDRKNHGKKLLKEKKEGIDIMCDILEKERAEGKAEGKAEGMAAGNSGIHPG